jgi:hypothetical protein
MDKSLRESQRNSGCADEQLKHSRKSCVRLCSYDVSTLPFTAGLCSHASNNASAFVVLSDLCNNVDFVGEGNFIMTYLIFLFNIDMR